MSPMYYVISVNTILNKSTVKSIIKQRLKSVDSNIQRALLFNSPISFRSFHGCFSLFKKKVINIITFSMTH